MARSINVTVGGSTWIVTQHRYRLVLGLHMSGWSAVRVGGGGFASGTLNEVLSHLRSAPAARVAA